MVKDITQQQLQTLQVLFINNLPQSELEGQRLVYHLRLAYGYYLDNFRSTPKKFAWHSQQVQHKLEYLKFLNDSLPIDIRQMHRQIEAGLQLLQDACKCGAIVSYQNKNQKRYLMIKDRNSGKYGFPKGKIGQGQTIQQCAIRQTREETGYNFQCSKTIYTVYMHNSSYNFCTGEVKEIRELWEKCEGQKYNHEIAEIMWVTKDWILNNTFFNAITKTVLQSINIFGYT